jgi:hypothetical protein
MAPVISTATMAAMIAGPDRGKKIFSGNNFAEGEDEDFIRVAPLDRLSRSGSRQRRSARKAPQLPRSGILEG